MVWDTISFQFYYGSINRINLWEFFLILNYFNSTMVQLIVGEDTAVAILKRNFNSTMVQLIAECLINMEKVLFVFQFYYGSINSVWRFCWYCFFCCISILLWFN